MELERPPTYNIHSDNGYSLKTNNALDMVTINTFWKSLNTKQIELYGQSNERAKVAYKIL